jgi:hypothetical protein
MQHLYASAPKGTLLVSPNSNLPWAFDHYDAYTYDFISGDGTKFVRRWLRHPVAATTKELGSTKSAYLILSSSQNNIVTQDGELPSGQLLHAESQILHSSNFRVVAENPSITVLTLGRPSSTLLGATPHSSTADGQRSAAGAQNRVGSAVAGVSTLPWTIEEAGHAAR